MSGLGRMLRANQAVLHTISGALFGSSTLAIPTGATLVTLVGKGGAGGNDSWYDPGQPFIAPVAYQAAVPAYYLYGYSNSGPELIEGFSVPGWGLAQVPDFSAIDNGFGGYRRTLTREAADGTIWTSAPYQVQVFSPATGWLKYVYHAVYGSYLVAAVPEVLASPGQPYIAPSSGGGVYTGASTTATLNSVTRTWSGGYGGASTESTQTLASTGAGQTLTYSVPAGGALAYSYTY